ncbi:pentapeptide repeat-containing protein [Nodosilinea sp. LEGE 07298]|uniref:serine/threonine-protein kinase n=1 Tax=Nodosilinea sp. LEGE 07298 TaxID=2777970 RepID=UPI00187DFAFC|nr:serine/threonine-protein kinase [Nodosilinea sp. LEGE 07298]MBE9108800.1 pentapeptide repeat-containing protein [Nodosilinea sp. LEGE 07298]
MSYCIQPDCSKPKNPPTVSHCQNCGAELLLRGRYRMIRALGRGGFGATFLARDELLPGKPPCVIKQLRPSAEAPHILEMARDLFKREAKILGMIGNHPQLPRLLDYFESDQEFFLVQEYINGLTLQQEVKRGGPFTEAGVKQFLSEILAMVQYVHDNHVIHRDIKPANIIRRDQDKKLVLIDFGAVKDKVNPTQAANSDQTALTAYAIGTPGYAPPEQMAMRPVYASDIYALGVTCVYLLAGKAPKDLNYDPNTGELLWREQVHISDHFAGVLQKMLEISVKHRYQSVAAIHRDLDLEPYMESLAQNMAFPSAAGPNSNGFTNSSGPVSNSSSHPSISNSGGSPSSRMAAAIRARRERSHSGAKSVAPLVPSRNGTPSPRPKVAPATLLTSDDVKQKYTKGRRDFSLQTFKDLDLQRTLLVEVNFNQSKLPSANFQGSDLSNANFGRANLIRATLRNAKLVKAYFHYANLEGADLRGANLAHACLSNANLRGANLCGADLTGALISDDQLASARTNWSTVMPNGRRGVL